MAAKSFQINKIQVSDKNNTTNKKKTMEWSTEVYQVNITCEPEQIVRDYFPPLQRSSMS